LDGAGKSPEDLQFIQRFNSHPGELKKALQVYEQVWLQSNQKSE
jgi:Tfp pilus assembly protein PilN